MFDKVGITNEEGQLLRAELDRVSERLAAFEGMFSHHTHHYTSPAGSTFVPRASGSEATDEGGTATFTNVTHVYESNDTGPSTITYTEDTQVTFNNSDLVLTNSSTFTTSSTTTVTFGGPITFSETSSAIFRSTVQFTTTSNVTVENLWLFANTSTITVAGPTTFTNTSTVTVNSSTVTFSNSTVTTFNGNVTFAKNVTFTNASTVTINGLLTIADLTTFTTISTTTVEGDWTFTNNSVVNVEGPVIFSSVVCIDTVALTITTNMHNYEIPAKPVVILTTTTDIDLTGLAKVREKQAVRLINKGPGTITIKPLDPRSSTLNQIETPGNRDYPVRPTEAVDLVRNEPANKWATMVTTGPEFVGDLGSGGYPGVVPAPAPGDAGKFLKGDATFAEITSADLPSTADTNARVAVRKNSGSVVGTRRQLNLIEGSNITLTVTDDSANEEVDVTIAAASSSAVGAALFNVTSVQTSAYSASFGDMVRCDTSGGGFTVDLPAAASNSGKIIGVKITTGSANSVTIDGNGGEQIEGSATYIMGGTEGVLLVCTGSGWLVASRYT